MTPGSGRRLLGRFGVWRVAFGVILAVSLAEPAVAQTAEQRRSDSPAAISKNWRRVKSANFVAEGDASESDLRAAATRLEAFRIALSRLYPGIQLKSATPTRIVVFNSAGTFRRFTPRDSKGRPLPGVAGYFSAGPEANYIVFSASSGRSDDETVFHEYTHFIMQRNVGDLPLWLNEGVADFFSTFELQKDGSALIGRAPAGRLSTIRLAGLRPLAEIVTPREVEKMWRSGGAPTFYAEAWALVHYLFVGRPNGTRAPIAAYMNALPHSTSPDETFKTAYGVDMDQMLSELRSYAQRRSFQAIVVPMPSDVSTSHEVEPVSEVDARLLRADLLLRQGATEEADKELAPIAAMAPENADIGVAVGRLQLAQNHPDESLATLTQAAQAAPSNFSAQYYLGTILASAWRHDAALNAFDRAIALNPSAAAPWFGLSISALALGRDAQSTATFNRGLALDGSRDWNRERAYQALAFGRDAVAVTSARAYMSQAGLIDETSQYTALVGAIAARRVGDNATADSLLDDLSQVLDRKDWTFQVVQFLQRRTNADQFLSRAKGDGQKTEAHTYIGFQCEIDGRRDDALAHFQWVATQGARNYYEYRMAKAEIERIKRIPPPSPGQPMSTLR